jgi:hypothetical protein
MREPTSAGDVSRPGTAQAAVADEDFLYHLYRGSEMLMGGRVVEAKEELEHALRRQPSDAKSQDLLAAVYFRLGFYPRAIEIWSLLAESFPDDATLRVNLALSLLKTGQPSDALTHLHVALQLAPDHDRAWGYLGLVQWRLGRFADAREAFLRGGQAAMARRMEDVLGSSAGAALAPGAAELGAGDAAVVRDAAEQAMAEFEAAEPALRTAPAESPPAPRRATREFVAVVPLADNPPRRSTMRGLPAVAPPRLATMLETWAQAPADGVALAVGPAGELFASAAEGVRLRLAGVRSVRGELQPAPVLRQARGRETGGMLGGEDAPLYLVRGPVSLVVAPPSRGRLHGVWLDDEVFYVREEALFAFEQRLGFESGRLPLGADSVPLVQLQGTGTVILQLTGAATALRVRDNEPVHVEPEALIGWTGRLFPDGSPPAAGSRTPGLPPLMFRGEGTLLLA